MISLSCKNFIPYRICFAHFLIMRNLIFLTLFTNSLKLPDVAISVINIIFSLELSIQLAYSLIIYTH